MEKTQHNNIDLPADSLGEVEPVENNPYGEWMTVTEMGKLLGLQRTERYWLVHKNVFETKMILGKMRVNVASFEDWYSRQIRYHKITGEEPGRKVKEVSYSAQDISELLGISEDRAYALIKENHLATETVNYRMRVPKDLFDQWYSRQGRYLTMEDRERNAELFETTITMPQMARLLGISRHTVYSILNSKTFGEQFEIIVVGGKKRITKSSFNDFLKSQTNYQLARDTGRKQKGPTRPFSSNLDDSALCKQGKDSAALLFGSEEYAVSEPESADQFFSETGQLTDSAFWQNASEGAYLPIAVAASLAGISRQSIVKHADRGRFEIKNIGGKNWVCRQEFIEWLDKRNQEGGKNMASLKKRNGKYCVIYRYRDKEGKKKQKWETFDSRAEAVKRMKEIEYKKSNGTFVVPQCKLMSELLKEYVDLYGKEKWALSTYDSNLSLISNYIEPVIGKVDLSDINTRFLETYYKTLLRTPTCTSKEAPEEEQKTISTSTIRDIHKLLKSCFKQAVKWELIEKNPADHATVPKYKPVRRQIWTADVLMHATEICDDDILKLAMNLSFSASLRIGELTGLTWDCVDISEEAIEEGRASIHITKEYQRVSKEAVEALDGKDIILVFPSESKLYKTVRVLKTPKTETSIRRVFLPRSVAEMLVRHKEAQDEMKAFLGSEFHDYGIVLASPTGAPIGETQIRKRFAKLIRDNNLPEVVFHSLRHSSVTYKLKLNGGDIKAVQGDSGHAQVSMVTDVYSHIIDEDRRKNAELFEEAFYGKKNLRPQMGDGAGHQAANTITLPEGVDAEALAKVLGNPEMMALLTSIAKTLQ